jgi:hypothetical protein
MSTQIVLEDGRVIDRPKALEGASVEEIEAWERAIRAERAPRKDKSA